MHKVGFTRASLDHNIFVKNGKYGSAMVTVHVDDMAATADNMMTLQHTLKTLQMIIDLVDMGLIKWFLGMQVSRDHRAQTISLSQSAYIDTVLKWFGMTDAYGISTPLDPKVILSTDICPSTEKEKDKTCNVPYLATVGSLMYVSMATCLDITYATNKLSQFNSNLGFCHWTAVQHVLHYLNLRVSYWGHKISKSTSVDCNKIYVVAV